MLLAPAPVIHSIYEELWDAFGSERLPQMLATALADEFVYTDPAAVLLGRDAFIEAVRELTTIRVINRLTVSAREMGGHVVVTGICALGRDAYHEATTQAFNALWRRAGDQWLCVAHRGATALMSADPVGR